MPAAGSLFWKYVIQLVAVVATRADRSKNVAGSNSGGKQRFGRRATNGRRINDSTGTWACFALPSFSSRVGCRPRCLLYFRCVLILSRVESSRTSGV